MEDPNYSTREYTSTPPQAAHRSGARFVSLSRFLPSSTVCSCVSCLQWTLLASPSDAGRCHAYAYAHACRCEMPRVPHRRKAERWRACCRSFAPLESPYVLVAGRCARRESEGEHAASMQSMSHVPSVAAMACRRTGASRARPSSALHVYVGRKMRPHRGSQLTTWRQSWLCGCRHLSLSGADRVGRHHLRAPARPLSDVAEVVDVFPPPYDLPASRRFGRIACICLRAARQSARSTPSRIQRQAE